MNMISKHDPPLWTPPPLLAARRIFLIGPSGCGKSTMAEKLVAHGFDHVETSLNFKKHHPRRVGESLGDFAERLSVAARPLVQKRWFLTDVLDRVTQKCVITGARNPFDFAVLFDPMHDAVVFFEGEGKSAFETAGIEACRQAVEFSRTYCDPVVFKAVNYQIIKQ
jgi:GTPase SAR1 family protein